MFPLRRTKKIATQFVQQAQGQLAPAYEQQVGALQSQIPAIYQLYDVLNQGLAGQQQAGNQAILENASGRGLLKSTIPVEGQTALGGQILQQQGQYAAQQAKEIAGVQSAIGGLRVEQANAVSELASALQKAFADRQALDLQQRNANREYALQKSLGNKQYQLALRAARS